MNVIPYTVCLYVQSVLLCIEVDIQFKPLNVAVCPRLVSLLQEKFHNIFLKGNACREYKINLAILTQERVAV